MAFKCPRNTKTPTFFNGREQLIMFLVMSLKLFKPLLTVLITNYTPQKGDFRGANQNLDYPQNGSVRSVLEHLNISPS